ncbi:hypothetical protein LXM94_00910 [Rhizobium sp. TRM95111]|uniref:hypothetical protein n=1 Tax=Rhizobium alarense TaxID=2846851 RepID=UPI001F1E9A65|nr:hypothetical protein [Rhizobium alarense]MCF3638527.1 hypothetical protein [Rhizobium alarense]
MLQKILTLLSIPSDDARADDRAPWIRDALIHPDIAAMDARALGDLPLGLFPAPLPPCNDRPAPLGRAA